MKETRKANIMFNKNGNGNDTTRITLPIKWVKELGCSKEDRKTLIKIDGKKITIIKDTEEK